MLMNGKGKILLHFNQVDQAINFLPGLLFRKKSLFLQNRITLYR